MNSATQDISTSAGGILLRRLQFDGNIRGIPLGVSRAQSQAALFNHAKTSPRHIARLEHLADKLLCADIALLSYDAPILIFNDSTLFGNLAAEHQNCLHEVHRFKS